MVTPCSCSCKITPDTRSYSGDCCATAARRLLAIPRGGRTQWDAAVDGRRGPKPAYPSPPRSICATPRLPIRPPRRPAPAGCSAATTGRSRVANRKRHCRRGQRHAPRLQSAQHLVSRPDGETRRRRFGDVGVTFPGAPTPVAGSNRSIAWGFTNSYGEFAKVIRRVPVANDAESYATAEGPRRFRHVDEAIEGTGRGDQASEHRRDAMGPVIGKDWEASFETHSTGSVHELAAIRVLNMQRLEQIRTAEEAISQAATFGIPGQNFVVADAGGHIGWTVAGRLPKRGEGAAGVPQLVYRALRRLPRMAVAAGSTAHPPST